MITRPTPRHHAPYFLRLAAFARYCTLIIVATLSPGTYDAPTRRALACLFCLGTWQTASGYLLGNLLVSAVLARIVAVTAASYGLSHLALEALIRVFVVELLPLVVALFVALRVAPFTLQQLGRHKQRPALRSIIPYVAANALAVIVLAILGGISAIVVAYLVVHGFSLWALPAYSRLIGLVFDLPLTLAFVGKLVFFALTVGIAPTSVVLDTNPDERNSRDIRVMARLLLMLLLIEASFLMIQRL